MSGFLAAKIAQFLPKNLTNRATISSIFIQKLNDFIYREIPPDLIKGSLIYDVVKPTNRSRWLDNAVPPLVICLHPQADASKFSF